MNRIRTAAAVALTAWFIYSAEGWQRAVPVAAFPVVWFFVHTSTGREFDYR